MTIKKQQYFILGENPYCIRATVLISMLPSDWDLKETIQELKYCTITPVSKPS